MSEMLRAIKNNDIDTLKVLIEQCADINAFIYKGFTYLMYAAESKNIDMVTLLIEKGANVNVVSQTGATALIQALTVKSFDIAKLLIKEKADVNAQTAEGYTVLMAAVETNNIDMVTSLIEKVVNVDAEDTGGTNALMLAVEGDLDIVKLLIEKGADVNAVMTNGYTFLTCAVQNNNIAIIELLIEMNAEVDAEDSVTNTALILAVLKGNLDIVKLLIDKGADVNAQTTGGFTALRMAVDEKNIAIVKLLIDNHADINASIYDGNTLLMRAVEANDIDKVKFLIEQGASVDAKNGKGFTALMVAAQAGNLDIVKLLIDKVGNVNSASKNGNTALMSAVRAGNLAIVKLLIEKRANIYAKDRCRFTALMLAILGNHTEIVEVLIEKVANTNTNANTNIIVNADIPNGYPFLAYAIENKNINMMKLLIDKGADVNVKILTDDGEFDAITYALRYIPENLDDEFLELVKLLVDAGADPFNMVARLPDFGLRQAEEEKIINMFRASNNIKAIAAAVSMVSANKPLLMQLSPETGEHDVSFAREELDKVKQYFEDNSIATPIPIYNEASNEAFSEVLSKAFNEALQEIQKIISQKIMADPETTEQFKELVQGYAKENKTESEEEALRDQLRSQLNHNDANQKAFEWLMTFKRHMININNPDSIHAKALMQEMVVYIVACRNNLLEAGKSTARSIDIEEALINQLHNLMQANDDLASCVDGTPRGLRGVLEFYLTMVKPKTSLELETEQLHKSVETLIKNMLWQEWEEIIQTHKESAANNAESINWPALKQELIRVCEAIVTLGLDNYSRASSAELLNTVDQAVNSYILDENLLGRSTHEPYDKARLELRRKIMYEKRYPTEDAFITAVLNHMRAAGNPEIELSEQSLEYLRQMYIAISNYDIRNEVYGYLEGDKEVEGTLPSILKKLEDEKLIYQIQEAPYKLAKLLPIKTNLNPVELAKTKNNIRSQLLIIIKDLVKQNKLPIHGDLANDVADDVMQALEQMPQQPAAILRHLQAAILQAKLASPREAVPDSISNVAGRILKFNTTPHDMKHKRDVERLHIKNDLISIIKQIDPSEAYSKAIAIIGTVLKKDNETISNDWSNIDKIDQYLRSNVHTTTQPRTNPDSHKPRM